MTIDYISQLDSDEHKHLQYAAKRIIDSRVSDEQKLYNKLSAEYIGKIHGGTKPKKHDELFSMSYCIAWQKAWGKTLKDWIDNGFHRVPYSRKLNAEEKKYVQYKMGV